MQLNTRSTAQLSEEVQGILDKQIPDPSGGIASIIGKPQTNLEQDKAHEDTGAYGWSTCSFSYYESGPKTSP